jgi:hypothetical protein
MTLDELWFYFSPGHDDIWLAPEEPMSDRERHMIQSQKLMITVVWNPTGFHRGPARTKGLKFNAGDHTRELLRQNQELARAAGSW